MANIIAVVVILAIIILAAGYVIRAKKRGQKCIGCPDSHSCGKNCSGGCSGCKGCSGGCAE